MERHGTTTPSSMLDDLTERSIIMDDDDEQEPREYELVSGDLCMFGREPYTVIHYRCDDYADGTITNIHGSIVKAAEPGSPHGFDR